VRSVAPSPTPPLPLLLPLSYIKHTFAVTFFFGDLEFMVCGKAAEVGVKITL
jgi:hypothetical protein